MLTERWHLHNFSQLTALCERHTTHFTALFICEHSLLRQVRKTSPREKEKSYLPCDLRAASDHSVDNSTAVLYEWLRGVQHLYHSVEWRPSEHPRWMKDLKLHLFSWSCLITHRWWWHLASRSFDAKTSSLPSFFQLLCRWAGSQTLAWLQVHPRDEVKAGSAQSCQTAVGWLHMGETVTNHQAQRIHHKVIHSCFSFRSLWTVTTCWQTDKCCPTW